MHLVGEPALQDGAEEALASRSVRSKLCTLMPLALDMVHGSERGSDVRRLPRRLAWGPSKAVGWRKRV